MVDNNHSCDQRESLYYAYQLATANYSLAFGVLEQRRGVLARDEYLMVRQSIDDARVQSEATRAALDQHTAQHG